MGVNEREERIGLDLNNPVFLENLFALGKNERNAVLDALDKLRKLTWNQMYRDRGLRWEKIFSLKPPAGVDALYSLRISPSRRAAAYRQGNCPRLLAIGQNHDATYEKNEKERRVAAFRVLASLTYRFAPPVCPQS